MRKTTHFYAWAHASTLASEGSFQQLPQHGCGVPLPPPPSYMPPSSSSSVRWWPDSSSSAGRAHPHRSPPPVLLLLRRSSSSSLLPATGPPPPPHTGGPAPPPPVELIPIAGPPPPPRTGGLAPLLHRSSLSPPVLLLLRALVVRLLPLRRASSSPPLLSLPPATCCTIRPPTWMWGGERERVCEDACSPPPPCPMRAHMRLLLEALQCPDSTHFAHAGRDTAHAGDSLIVTDIDSSNFCHVCLQGVAHLSLTSPTRVISMPTRALVEFELHALSDD
jgi:hypothetical protein